MQQLLLKSLEAEVLAPAFSDDIAHRLAQTVLSPMAGISVYPRSISAADHRLYFLGRRENEKYVGIITKNERSGPALISFNPVQVSNTALQMAVIPADAKASDFLKTALPFLRPRIVGKDPSIGCGDRLGLATPGHVCALVKTQLGAVLCQQSVRENSRTGRSPRQVLDDAMWGAWQEGWRKGYGADADHLKTASQIDTFVESGYTFFTADVGDHLDNKVDRADTATVEAKVAALPWDRLQSTASDLIHRLTRRPVELDGSTVDLTRADILRAAAKHGAAVAQAYEMYQHLCHVMGQGAFEFEISIDETETATTLAEHIYMADELTRLGVVCASLAPRFVGTFEKGVDYIGDVNTFI
ncbi:MAG: hypothetical protein JW932_05595 [Deltaproteobacteria bacterium]|nr:hypothetical protein [Deltaproteobacteria bacterium]